MRDLRAGVNCPAYRIDAVPAPWAGPRRRGGGPIEVPTPVDRKPPDG